MPFSSALRRLRQRGVPFGHGLSASLTCRSTWDARLKTRPAPRPIRSVSPVLKTPLLRPAPILRAAGVSGLLRTVSETIRSANAEARGPLPVLHHPPERQMGISPRPPQQVLSPVDRLKSLSVVYTHPARWWSLATGLWDGNRALLIRWNGDQDRLWAIQFQLGIRHGSSCLKTSKSRSKLNGQLSTRISCPAWLKGLCTHKCTAPLPRSGSKACPVRLGMPFANRSGGMRGDFPSQSTATALCRLLAMDRSGWHNACDLQGGSGQVPCDQPYLSTNLLKLVLTVNAITTECSPELPPCLVHQSSASRLHV